MTTCWSVQGEAAQHWPTGLSVLTLDKFLLTVVSRDQRARMNIGATETPAPSKEVNYWHSTKKPRNSFQVYLLLKHDLFFLSLSVNGNLALPLKSMRTWSRKSLIRNVAISFKAHNTEILERIPWWASIRERCNQSHRLITTVAPQPCKDRQPSQGRNFKQGLYTN